ncbi:MAG TPA: aminotransferase class V-fold PLP-dependent enzyme [Dyella sp.]|uniref:aminotransferase class V-fold PLP-dependent enzyme n=1 Tax=Dyella sp. TaxID=1869338 RepID=UPI002D770FFE|nr:aminotransferase class V-fold PLP-dependent enzyme [Dyella sp.]HET6553394.1 aminotransferase class V-fold PLP-dependent enzyme [Dyella sp.]
MPYDIAPLIDPALFDMPPGLLWLSHCKDGPITRAAADRVQSLLATELRPWELRWQEDFLDVQQRLRSQGAALLGVAVDDISLASCTSTGLETVAMGFPWAADDEVVIPAGEFPSNRLPWLALARRGVHCKEVPLWEGQLATPRQPPRAGIAPERRLLDAITSRTRVMAVSWVRFQDGLRLDLETLGHGCRERGVHLVVDGIQGAGTMMPVLDHASAFATGGHKGLLGMQGQGLLWTDAGFRKQLMPLGTWLSAPAAFSQSGRQDEHADHWASDGRYLEAGSPSIVSCAALAESIGTLLAAGGPPGLQAHIARLQRMLLEILAPRDGWRDEAARLLALLDAERLGPTLCFDLPAGQAHALLETARSLGIDTSTREGFLRTAWHGWHGSDDVKCCAAWLTGQTA